MNQDAIEAKQLYDDQAELFTKNQAANRDVQNLREIVYGHINAKASDKILFAGCGDGVECIAASSVGSAVTAIDISPKNIENANTLGLSNVDFQVMDIQNLKFSNRSFNVVVSILTVMYVKDLVGVLQEFKRVLQTDGKVILAVPHPVIKMMKYNASDNYFLHGKQWEEWNGIKRFNYYRTFEDYSAAFNEAGLRIKTIREPEPVDQSQPIKYPYFIVFELVLD